jgi:UDP-N-acetylglucosamine--N-acetylmuramyl-(pentapeptide) pyrophosphoryl-undecaprenol N-acetylglucosamine transferase
VNLSKRTNLRECNRPKIAISGIGSGGHYFPAVVTAIELLQRGYEVFFLVRKGFQEEKIARRYGLKTFPINSRPFFGRSIFDKVIFAFILLQSVFRLHALTRRGIGLAFGGFGAVPLNISCLLNRSPFYVFEPNRVPGRATKFFAHSAHRVFLGLPPAASMPGNTSVTGIPIRPEFKMGRRTRKGGRPTGKVHILVYGGSQGARFLNDMALALQDIIPRRWSLTIISGLRDYARVISSMRGDTHVIPFSETPWDEICGSDVLVSRAGALAGYEILASGKRVLFVPFPHAIDDHQYHNALYFVKIGNALLRVEKELTPKELVGCIHELMKRRSEKKTNLIMDAEKKIADLMIEDIENEKH